MVYTERTEKCISTPENKGNDSASANAAGKHAKHSHDQASSSKSSSSGSSSSYNNNSSNNDKWKYNNMVRDNRDKFNHLHNC